MLIIFSDQQLFATHTESTIHRREWEPLAASTRVFAICKRIVVTFNVQRSTISIIFIGSGWVGKRKITVEKGSVAHQPSPKSEGKIIGKAWLRILSASLFWSSACSCLVCVVVCVAVCLRCFSLARRFHFHPFIDHYYTCIQKYQDIELVHTPSDYDIATVQLSSLVRKGYPPNLHIQIRSVA